MTLALTNSQLAIRTPRPVALFVLSCLLLLLAVGALAIDLSLARWLERHPPSGDLARLVRLSEVFAWGGSVLLISVLAARLDARGWRIGVLLACGSLGSGLVADSLKLVIARTRPAAMSAESWAARDTFGPWLPGLRRGQQRNAAGQSVGYGHGQQSFPSAHAATAAGLAMVLARLYQRGRLMFALFATLACLQRLAAGAHFLSDVLVGAAIGTMTAGLFLSWGIGWLPAPPPASNQGHRELK